MFSFKKENQALCPFCDNQLEEIKSMETRFCNKPNITADCFKQVCANCGSVPGYRSANEFVDFFENMRRIRKKSVYHIF